MKVQISINDDLAKRIDDYAKQNYMSRSGLISFACTQYLNQADVITSINRISFSMKKIADEGKIDESIYKEFEDIERLTQIMVGNVK